MPNVDQAVGPAQGRGPDATGASRGGRNRHAANLTDLAKPAKDPQSEDHDKKQRGSQL